MAAAWQRQQLQRPPPTASWRLRRRPVAFVDVAFVTIIIDAGAEEKAHTSPTQICVLGNTCMLAWYMSVTHGAPLEKSRMHCCEPRPRATADVRAAGARRERGRGTRQLPSPRLARQQGISKKKDSGLLVTRPTACRSGESPCQQPTRPIGYTDPIQNVGGEKNRRCVGSVPLVSARCSPPAATTPPGAPVVLATVSSSSTSGLTTCPRNFPST